MSTNGTAPGEGQLSHDSKWGNITNALAAAAITGAIAALHEIDWSSFPGWVGIAAGPLVGMVVGLLTSKALPRFKRRA